ncbi:MAG TPA: LpqB family beta-propeller domain-containing protein, partial [Micromonosporaceae bacterium]|nr:LpqB family beta-propeller domain-containing protein [Micromonosporaceae bacterium]
MRTHGAGIAVTLTLTALLAGCGVPDSGVPVVDEPARPVKVTEPAELRALPIPEDAKNSVDAVKLYFAAAAVEWSRLKQQTDLFLSEKGRAEPGSLQPGQTIPVIRLTLPNSPEVIKEGTRQEVQRVRATGRVIGRLTESGVLLPASGKFSHTFELQLGQVSDGANGEPEKGKRRLAWLIDNPPPDYLLSLDALTERYDALPLYFSNQSATATLIPEQRYVRKAMGHSSQRSLLVDWLLQGPSESLSPAAVRGFPDGTERRGPVYEDNQGVLVVKLNTRAADTNRSDLMLAQLVWTLSSRMGRSQRLTLRIDDQPVVRDGRSAHSRYDFEAFNAMPEFDDGTAAYFINKKREVDSVSEDLLPDVVSQSNDDGETHNTDVVSAALSGDRTLAVLVRRPGARWSLEIGRRSALRASASRYAEVTGLPSGPIGRPAWASGVGAEGSVLFMVGRALYLVDLKGARAQKVETSSIRDVDAVAVAPDGFRVALVSQGRLYVTVLAEQGEVVELGKPRPVTDQVRDVTDVAWRSEHSLVVLGRGPQGTVSKVDIDGRRVEALPEPGGGAPDQVAAYPTRDGNGQVLVAHG